MSLEQEQMSDAMWAISVINGRGTPEDSLGHAQWMLAKLSEIGCTETIRNLAFNRLPKKDEATA